MNADHAGVRELDRDQCLNLLDTTHLGRVALSDRALPIILPVIYSVRADEIVFQTAGRLLSTAARDGHVVCFEADGAGHEGTDGWSVLVIGQLGLAAGADDEVGAGPWLDSGAASTVRLPTTIVSGRAVGEPLQPVR
jgi:uncharacterized protein